MIFWIHASKMGSQRLVHKALRPEMELMLGLKMWVILIETCLERKSETYVRRLGVFLQRGIVQRIPWCKDYREPLPFTCFRASVIITGPVQASAWSPDDTGNVTLDSITALSIQEKVVPESLKQLFDKCCKDVEPLVC